MFDPITPELVWNTLDVTLWTFEVFIRARNHAGCSSAGECTVCTDAVQRQQQHCSIKNTANVDFCVPAANVTAANVTVSTVGFAQSAAPSALPVLTYQQVPSGSAAVSNVSGVSVASAAVRAGARADRPGVHADLTDQVYDSEVSAYFRNDSPPPPAPFYYGPSPPGATSPFASVHSRADSRQSRTSYRSVSRQPRAPSRQSVMSVHFHASGRQSTHSQAPDPVIELVNKMFDKVAGDAAAQRADAAAQRANAAAQQARMEREIERREREAADKTRLQLRVEQLEKEAATALLQLTRPATTQRDSVTPATGALQSAPGDTHTLMISADRHHAHSPPPVTADGVTYFTAGTLIQPTAAARDVHSLALSAPAPAPAPADTQHAAPPSMTDYALLPTVSDMTVAGPPRVPPRTPALTTYPSMYTVDVDRALPIMSNSQFSTMAVDRCDIPMPLYTTPSVAPAVTSVVSTPV